MENLKCNAAQDPKVAQYVQETMSKILLDNEDCNWGALLSAGPSALVNLAQCLVVANSSEAAALIELKQLEGMESTSLRANLQHLIDLGFDAFFSAETEMQVVNMTTGHICGQDGTIDKILQVCKNEKLASAMLQGQLDRLEMFSQKCLDRTNILNEKFTKWSELADIIVRSSTARRDENARKGSSLKDDMENTTQMQEHLKQEKKDAKASRKDREKIFEERQKALEMAQATLDAEMNPGYAKLLYRLVSDAMDSGAVGTIANAASTVAGPYLSQSALRFVQSLLHAIDPEAHPNQPAQDQKGTIIHDTHEEKTEDQELLATMTKPLTQLGINLESGSHHDPANTNWDRVFGKGQITSSDGGPTFNITLITKILDGVGSKFTDLATGSRQDIQSLQEHASKLAHEILDASLHQDVETSHEKLEEWRSRTSDIMEAHNKLEERLRVEAKQQRAAKRKQRKEQRSKARRDIAIHEKRVADALEDLRNSQDNLDRLAAEDVSRKREFNETQLALQKLAMEEKTVVKVRKVLEDCLKRLQRFKDHLTTFRRFFGQLNTLVKHLNEDIVGDVVLNGKDILNAKDAEVMALNLEQIRTGVYQLLANYQVAGQITGTYVMVSRKHIMPGVKELNRLVIEGSSETMQTDLQQINTFAKKAQSQISKLADERRETIRKQLIVTTRRVTEEKDILPKSAMNPTVEEVSDYDDEWDTADAPAAPVVSVAAA